MERLGEYEYPSLASFKDALSVVEDAVTKYGGIIPNIEAARKLGYNVKDASAISGSIYRRFDDLCAFGLTTRDRGGLKATPLATDALDPYDATKATQAKARAIRNVKLIVVAFEAWKGEMPNEDAFPAKLAQVTGVPWTEAQKHSKTVRSLFAETFPYLVGRSEAAREEVITYPRKEMSEQPQTPRGELRTTVGSIIITDLDTLSIAEQYLLLLKKQFARQTDSQEAVKQEREQS